MSNEEECDPNFMDLPEQGAVEGTVSSKTETTMQGDNFVRPKWSQVLQSPTTGYIFSPSNEMNKPDSLHGLGE